MKKRLFSWLISGALAFLVSLTACTSAPAAEKVNLDKAVVIYFSESGNSARAAQMIAEQTKADIFRITPVQAYPSDYHTLTEQALREKGQNLRPQIRIDLADVNKYDTVFLCYPIWWGTMPMPVFTFLERVNLSGKKIVPLATHEGSRFGSSLDDLERAAPGADIVNPLQLRGGRVAGSAAEIAEWLNSMR